MGVQTSELLSKGSRLLPDQSRQPPPVGAHAPPADLLGVPPVANTENFCSTRFQPHFGALRRLLVVRQHEFLEDVPAVGTGVFKDRHGKPISLLRFDVTAFLLGIPRRGGRTPRSCKARDSGNAWQDHEPDHQKENENQEAFHIQIIRSCRTGG